MVGFRDNTRRLPAKSRVKRPEPGGNAPGFGIVGAGHNWLIRSAVFLGLIWLGATVLSDQSPAELPQYGGSPVEAARFPGPAKPMPLADVAEEQVVEVRVLGHRQIPIAKILPLIKTRADRAFSSSLIEQDVHRLNGSGLFVSVVPKFERVAGGRVVIFEVLERPTLAHVRYVGNEAISKRTLAKQTLIAAGDPMDPHSVEEARRKMEEYYRSKGFAKVRISVKEGNRPTDAGATFLINEGPKERILWTKFVGNTIANDARLRTQIKSKQGILWTFGGEVDEKQIEEDINRLTAYYRGLGFFQAKIGRSMEFGETAGVFSPLYALGKKPTWLTLTFVINEGPRYKVRDVSVQGNRKYSSEELLGLLELKTGDYFDQADLALDTAAIKDRYGEVGYVFAAVEPNPLFMEEPGQLDLVYQIDEGRQCRVGRINVQIGGECPHTRITTVYNRISLKPGDIIDTRELRASERRLRSCGLFEVSPQKGIMPTIAISPPSAEDIEAQERRMAGRSNGANGFRGQSPEPRRHVGFRPIGTGHADGRDDLIDVTVRGRWSKKTAEPGHSDPRRQQRPTQPFQPPPTGGPIVRGQYSGDSGTSVPSLPRGQAYQSNQPAPRPSAFPPETYRARTTDNARDVDQAFGVSADSAPSYGQQYVPPPQMPAPRAGRNRLPFLSGEGILGDQHVGQQAPLSGLAPNEEPPLYIPLNPRLRETQTGRFMFSVGVNSDAGLLGSIIVDEQNFDWRRYPRSWSDIRDFTAWRGGGQRFRVEAVPGTQVQRYSITFQEPYLMNTDVGLGLNGFFFNRRYRWWDEERLGGRISLGYQFDNDLAGSFAFRTAKINISNPVSYAPQPLLDVEGDSSLFGFRGQLAHDTRDNTFLATEGHYFQMGFEYVLGSYEYPRADVDFRKYFMMHQRPDGSGRHVLSMKTSVAITGQDTPMYEHYFAGGYSTIRGFRFRGASTRENTVPIGGHFSLLASVQYMFPITADDMIRGVIFCDTGTTQPTIDNWSDRYRVSPGLGLRITVPAMGPAPIALDFAFPAVNEGGDEIDNFSFFVGFMR